VQIEDGPGGVVDLLENLLPTATPCPITTEAGRVQGLPALRPPKPRPAASLKAAARS
jgi:hypothetical protein